MKQKSTFEELGDRMKGQYERRSQTLLPRRTNTIIRIDGRAFHTWTKGMDRPVSTQLIGWMDRTACDLMGEIGGAKMAFVQSDEISILTTDYDKIETQAWFDGEVQKLCSIVASYTTARFIKHWLSDSYPDNPNILDQRFPNFDARCFTVPDPVEVHNYFVWRQRDAERNAMLSIGQSCFGHQQMQGCSPQGIRVKMTLKNGVGWEDSYPKGYLHGRTIWYTEDSRWVVDPKAARFVDDPSLVDCLFPESEDRKVVHELLAKN